MKGLPTSFNSAVGVRHELHLHVGREFLRVYEHITIAPECRGGGARMMLGRPLAKLPNTPASYDVLRALYPTLDPGHHAAAA